MDIQKINDYIDAYSKAIELPEDYKKILKELMPRIIEKYSKTISSVSVKEDDYTRYVIKPVNGEYSVEDFFLNRLMRNVWSTEKSAKAKGNYSASSMCVHIDESKIETQLDGWIDNTATDFGEICEIARKKVIMHEFEHALQTQFKGETLPLTYRSTYRKIIEELQKIKGGKYAKSIQSFEEINEPEYGNFEDCTHLGLNYYYPTRADTVTYSEVDGRGNLNEIFNETEALEMANAKPQIRHTYPNGVYYVIRNIESSNYPITNYGNIIKTLVGDELTFIGMYLNPEELFKTFNAKYNDVFHTMYETDKDAWQILIEQIKLIKDNKNNDKINYNLNQKLQETLAKCLEKDIEAELQKGDADLETMKKKIVQFRGEALNADDKETRSKIRHFAILKSLKEKVELAYQKQQEGVDELQIHSEKSGDEKKTRTGDRWIERPITRKQTETRNAADKWSVSRTAKRTTRIAVDKWGISTQNPREATDTSSDRWVAQPHSKDKDDPTTDTSKGGSGGNLGLAQEMGQTPYLVEAEKRKHELSFSAVKRAMTKAKITKQEINDETLQIKEREELDMLKKKGLIKTPAERARYTYLKAKYEPPVQSQQKGQSRGQSR